MQALRPSIEAKYIEVIAQAFTLEELSALVGFQSTAVGEAAISKLPLSWGLFSGLVAEEIQGAHNNIMMRVVPLTRE